VDSELTLLLMPPYDISGAVQNPLAQAFPESPGEERPPVLVVSRLDGPDPDTARRLVDDALEAERYGLLGRLYGDARGISRGGYARGDFWIREAYQRFRREGFECVFDQSETRFTPTFPMQDAALYFGWYTTHADGPFADEGFRLAKGAVAAHIHSSAATTLRSDSAHWAGPLLARGAAATFGAVYEPYLHMTLDLQVLSDRLCGGLPFGESALYAQPYLSWQMSVIGDPLYTPFKHDLEQQVRHLEEDAHPGLAWGYLRRVNRLVLEERFNLALDACRAAVERTGSLVLCERLGDLYAKNKLFDDAAGQYLRIVRESREPRTAIRVGARCVLMYRLLGRANEATALDADLCARWEGHPLLPWLDTSALQPGEAARPPGP